MAFMVSIVCPVYNEEKYIRDCIDSILCQDYPKEGMEVIFVDGNSTDNTVKIIEEYTNNCPFIRVIRNPARIAPVAMNLGIKESRGEIIVRLDAHATYAPNYVSVLVNKLIELNADNVGSPCKTDVLNKNPKTLAIREVLSNRVGVGNSIFRIGINKVKEVDTVPFGCWRKDIFGKIGFFDVRLNRNQDFELNKRIKKNGGKIYIIPDTYCIYYARETFKKIAKNAYDNGKWNILTIFYTKDMASLSLRHYIPVVFLFSLFVPLLFMKIFFMAIHISIFSLCAYLLLIIVTSISLTIKKKIKFIYLFFTFFILHISNGFGAIAGIITSLFLIARKNTHF
jgi:glycosyltransferase involved in cell wall biosynthesis